MGIVAGVWVSPLALGALAFGAMLGLRASWWQVLAAVIVAAACGLLAVIGAFTVARRIERHDERRWQQRHAREVPAAVTATVIPQAPAPPAIVNNYYIRFGPADREAARIIRTALPGDAGEKIITEE